jgi:hypothetical protein
LSFVNPGFRYLRLRLHRLRFGLGLDGSATDGKGGGLAIFGTKWPQAGLFEHDMNAVVQLGSFGLWT